MMTIRMRPKMPIPVPNARTAMTVSPLCACRLPTAVGRGYAFDWLMQAGRRRQSEGSAVARETTADPLDSSGS